MASDGRIIIDTEIDNSGAAAGAQKLKNTINQSKQAFSGYTRETQKLQRQLETLKYQLGGEVPQATQEAYQKMSQLNQEIRQVTRQFGTHSSEAMKAKNALHEFALGLDDTTFKQVYMRSQLGLTDAQLQQQANSIKLNARMTKLMGNQTEILTRQMQGLQKFGIKPKDMLPASTIGQFQMLNETVKASGSPIYALSSAYRNLGTTMEKHIKNWSAQKLAVKMAGDDMVKYGILLRGMTAATMNMGLAFPIVGIAAFAFYSSLFSAAFQSNEALQKLSETVKGKLAKAFQPLIQTTAQFLTIVLTLVGKVADWVTKFNELHPIAAKILSVITLLAPAMTLLLLPLGAGVGLLAGWKLALNGVWVLIGPIVTMIGTASATFLTFAAVIGAVVGGLIYFYKTNETFRSTVNSAWDSISKKGGEVFGGLAKYFSETLPNAFKSGGIEGVIGTIGNSISSIVSTITTKAPDLLKSGGTIIQNFLLGIQANLPAILTKGSEIVTNLINGIAIALPQIIAKMNETRMIILNTIASNLPQIMQTGVQIITLLIMGIAQALPLLLNIGIQIITAIINTIVTNLPTLISTGITVLTTLLDGIIQALPVLIEAGVQVLDALVDAITENLPLIIDAGLSILNTLVQAIIELLPTILDAGIQILIALINGITEAIPKLIEMLPTIIETTVKVISENLPKIIEAGIKILVAVIEGLIQALPQLSAMVPDIINAIVSVLIANLPQLLQAGVELIDALIKGLIQAIPALLVGVAQVWQSIKDSFANVDWASIGMNIIKGIGQGIENAKDALLSKASGIANSVKEKIQSAFDIHSPSRWMRDMIGKNIVRGIGVGIDLETPTLLNDADNMVRELKTSMDFNTARTTANIAGSANKAANVSNSTTTIHESDNGPKVYIENFNGTDKSNIVQLAQEIAFLDKRKPN